MRTDRRVPPELIAAFSPVHKAAFGIAVGIVCGLATFGVTAFHLVVRPVHPPNLELLSQFFHGYSVSWPGAAIGFLWAGFAGFVGGWFAAFVRNLVVALWIVVIKTRAELSRVFDVLSQM